MQSAFQFELKRVGLENLRSDLGAPEDIPYEFGLHAGADLVAPYAF